MIQTDKTYEHDNTTGTNCEGPDANTPVSRLTVLSIIGDKVVNIEGEHLGYIKDIMLNTHSGIAEYAVVEHRGVLGIGSKLFAIPFSEMYLDPIRKVFKVERSKAFFQDAPGFDKSHWPDTNLHEHNNFNYDQGVHLLFKV